MAAAPKDQPVVDSTEALDAMMERAYEASLKFKTYNQKQVDKIFAFAALKATDNRVDLAKMAVEEGGMGVVEDKTIKNHFSAEYVHNTYRDTKTCGIVERDESGGYVKMAEPIGVLAGVVPCTNPTSTTIFKCLLALKTRNTIVFSPHPRTAKCTVAAAKICRDAAILAGAPEDCIGWIDLASKELCAELMHHKRTTMIVATGAGGLVKAAYSSGKPAMGGGAGNTPVIIDETADIPMAVNSVILSKTFDNGMICASEQSVICCESVADQVREEFDKRGAYVLKNEAEKKLMGDFILSDNGVLNPEAVGQPAWKLTKLAGIKDSPDGSVLVVAPLEVVGPSEKLSHEKLCPCIGFYREKDFQACLDRGLQLLEYGGMGHTSVLYTDSEDTEEKRRRVQAFSAKMPTGRTLIGMPTSQGAIGDIFNFRQMPSLSLGCGSWGMNASSEGLQVKHLLNYKIVTERREHILWFKVPPAIYFNRGIIREALTDLRSAGLKKAFIVTDKPMVDLGFVKKLTKALDKFFIQYMVFSNVTPDPTDEVVNEGVEEMKKCQPDHIIAFGGGSPIDAAKVMRLLYEHPEAELSSLYTRFMDLRKRVVKFPKVGSKIKKVVAIPTTSGTGAEMTPFAVITDAKLHIKYPMVDYLLTPDIAIMDGDFVTTMPRMLASHTGIDALTHAVESYVSMFATDYTKGLSMQAIQLLFQHLDDSVNKTGEAAEVHREVVHNAASIAGMAFANAFLGICHSMAHQLGACFQIPHGLANALLLCQVIKFNAEDAPSKMGTFPQYTFPRAKADYAEIADGLGVTTGNEANDDEKVDRLVMAIQDLKKAIEIPMSIREYGVDEKAFMDQVDRMALLAFDDQCTGTNPRYPLIPELRQLFVDAYEGTVRFMPASLVVPLTRQKSLLELVKSM